MAKIFRQEGCWFFDDYFQFVEARQSAIPQGIRDHVLNVNRYLFNHAETLHDAWLLEAEYTIDLKSEKSDLRIHFLGASHDKRFEFCFYNIDSVEIPAKPLTKIDLLVHQFGFEKSNRFSYEFHFSNEEKIKVLFESADCSVKEIEYS